MTNQLAIHQDVKMETTISEKQVEAKPSDLEKMDNIDTTNTPITAAEAVFPWHDDPANPHNWPVARKYTVTLLLSTYVFNALMSSTMIAPALSQITKDLHISSDSQTQLVLSIYVLSYAAGYFLWAPLSEIHGRVIILQLASTWFLIWNIVCGFATNKALITAGRLFSGSGAAASLAISTGMMGEVWRAEQRGRSLAVLSIMTNLGPSVGPILGGVIAQQSLTSWRWAFWASSILNAMMQLLSFRFLHESHAQTILKRIYQNQTGEALQINTWRASFRIVVQAMQRPFYLFFTQPASQGIVIYAGLSFGNLYTIIVSIPFAFESIYHQSILIASLNYLSFGIGATSAAQICGPLNDFWYRHNVKQHMEKQSVNSDIENVDSTKDTYKPPAEVRLFLLAPSVLLMTAGLLAFGWSLENGHIHWIIPNIGFFLFGFGSQIMVLSTNAYMIDIFCDIKSLPAVAGSVTVDTLGTDSGNSSQTTTRQKFTLEANINWTASALASIWAFKSLCGFAYPLFAFKMIKGLGWGWSFTLLGLLNLVSGLLLTGVMLKWGPDLRARGRRTIEQRR